MIIPNSSEKATLNVLLTSHHASRRGSAISLIELGVRLPQNGFIPIFLFSKWGPLFDDLINIGFEAGIVERKGFLRIGMIFRVMSIIIKNDIKLVHVNSAVSFSRYVALAAWIMRVPVVWHIREPVQDKRMLRQRAWVRRLASKIIVLTREQADFFRAPWKVLRVFNGVDLSKYNLKGRIYNDTRSDLGLNESDFVFIQVGSIEPNKGQFRSICALELIQTLCPQARLIIVGGVVDCDEMNLIDHYLAVRPTLKSIIRFAGERNDVAELISISDCLLLPSKYESFPRTIMEGMASGCPVIATRVGAIEDMVSPSADGFLIAPGDVQELSNAMRDIASMNKNKIDQMKINARTSAVRKFGINEHVNAIANIYRSLTGGGNNVFF